MSAKLVFTCGDPAGVGPEIIAAWLASYPAEARDVAVIGPARWLASWPSPRLAVGSVPWALSPSVLPLASFASGLSRG